MNLQVGLLYRGDRNASSGDCLSILGEFAYRNTETGGQMCDGPLAIAYSGDLITWEELEKPQPHAHGPYILTFDGRLDNREHLARRISMAVNSSVSDLEIIAKSYEQLGETILPELIGEFALTIWSRDARTLVFLRSECGARPLYYLAAKDRVLWSSDFHHLVTTSKTPLTVDDAYVFGYLVGQPEPTQTPFKEIHAVPPGTVVRFKEGNLQSSTVSWEPDLIQELCPRRDEEYEEILGQLLRDAVRARLRAKGTVVAELSGGLDSSSVVLLADEILRDNKTSTQELRTVSCVYEESADTADERYFISQVEARRGFKGRYVHETDQQITLGLEATEFTGVPNPMHCFPGRYPAIAAYMRSLGAHVLLTGLGGDNLFWADAEPAVLVADCLWNLRFATANRQCALWSRCTRTPYWQLLFKEALPLAVGGLCPNPPQYATPDVPMWISKYDRNDIFAQVKSMNRRRRISRQPGLRAKIRMVEILFGLLRTGYVGEYRDLYISHPMTYRPLVEFCLALPLSQLLREGETRSLMRRTMKNVLPDKILHRRGKGVVSEAMARAIQREWPRVRPLLEWELCRRGYVDAEKLSPMIEQIRLGFVTGAGDLIRLFSIEKWFRSLNHIRQQTTENAARRIDFKDTLPSSVIPLITERRNAGTSGERRTL